MNFAASACGLISGLMLSTGIYAQEAGQNAGQNIEPVTQIPAESELSEKLLRDAEELMKAGKSAEAYDLLEPFEFDRSGEVRFDYLIGIAALDSGKPDKATLAFERVMAEDPDYSGARLDLARAYYQLGDMRRAKTEFETVLEQNPSEVARATIQKYLDYISGQGAVRQTIFSGYLEGIVGHDSNVNNASETLDNIPSLSPGSTELADNYFRLGVGGEVIHNLNANLRLYAGADLNQRSNYKQKSFNEFNIEERVGAIYGTGIDRFRLGVSGGQNTLGGTRYRNISGINAEWRHAVGINNQLSVFGQYYQYRYVDTTLTNNNLEQRVAGFGWLHVLSDKKSTLSGSLYGGTESDVGPVTLANPGGGRTDGARRFGGIRVGGQAATGDRVKLFFSAGVQQGVFDKVNALIGSQRSDRLDDFTLGAYLYLDKLWSVSPQLVRINNMSEVAAYSYDRTDFSLTVRRNFK